MVQSILEAAMHQNSRIGYRLRAMVAIEESYSSFEGCPGVDLSTRVEFRRFGAAR